MNEVTVIGAGPAGCAIVGELARIGVKVTWVAPDIEEPWPNSYGAWVNSFPEHLRHVAFAEIYPEPCVAFRGHFRTLDAPYGRVDNDALKAQLLENSDYVAIHEKWQEQVDSTWIVDATGFSGVGKNQTEDCAFQTAFGVTAKVDGEPLDGRDMALMDFSEVGASRFDPPRFLYAMRLKEDLWFLEETVLAARPAVAINQLKDSLHARLKARGVEVVEVFHEERCVIPMGYSPIEPQGNVIPFGAAAGFVHPATGYSLSRTLNTARPLSQSIAAMLAGVGDLNDVTNSIWPVDKVRTRRLHLLGLETLLAMPSESVKTFLDVFLSLPEELWLSYMLDTASPAESLKVMWQVFQKLPWKVRRQVLNTAIRHAGPARV